jgi:hypothetical protein
MASSSDAKSRLNVICLQIHKMPPVFETQRKSDKFSSTVKLPPDGELIVDETNREFLRKSDAEQFIALVALIRIPGTDEHIVFDALFALQTQSGGQGFSQAEIRARCDIDLSKTAVNRVLYSLHTFGCVERNVAPQSEKPLWRLVVREQVQEMQDGVVKEDAEEGRQYEVTDDLGMEANDEEEDGCGNLQNIVLLDGDHGAPEGATWRSRGVFTVAFVGHAFAGNIEADEIVRASMPVREASDMMAAFWAGKHFEMLRSKFGRVYIASNDAGWMQLAHALRSNGIDTIYCRANGAGEHVW